LTTKVLWEGVEGFIPVNVEDVMDTDREREADLERHGRTLLEEGEWSKVTSL